jgi:tetratricopeptide (TPR) repeat protein
VEEALAPGEYHVEVTSTKEGRADVTKKQTFIVVDKAHLIAKETEITKQDLDKANYTTNSWKPFEQAFNKAREVIGDPEATQIEVDNALAELEAAYDGLVYLSNLQKEIEAELEESHYSKASWAAYQLALKEAQAVLNNPDSTQKEIDAAEAALAAARAALTVDKTLLEEAVEQSDDLNDTDYSKASWTNYQKALKAGKAVLNDPNATQAEVDAAEAALKAAYKALTVDKTALEKQVSEVDDLRKSDYIDSSWTVYQKALERAKAVLADRNATQAEIDAAYEALVKAQNELEKVKGKGILPNTFTNIYNWLMLGLALLLFGLVLFIIQKRRMKTQEL